MSETLRSVVEALVALTFPVKVEVPKVLVPERKKVALVVENARAWLVAWPRKFVAEVVENPRPSEEK